MKVRVVDGGQDLNAFIDLPYRLHAADPLWVPPLRIDTRSRLSRKKNPFFDEADALFGLLTGALKARGAYDDAVVILTADHGQRTLMNEFLSAEQVCLYAGITRQAAGANALVISTGVYSNDTDALIMLDIIDHLTDKITCCRHFDFEQLVVEVVYIFKIIDGIFGFGAVARYFW